MLYEVINPSDCVTLEADDELVACVATLLLGQGRYGLKSDNANKQVLPIMFHQSALDDWLKEKQIVLDDFIDQHSVELAECLESALVCSMTSRAALIKAIEASGGDKKAAFATYNEERRTSMNNICGRAAQLASYCRSLPKTDLYF